MTALIATLSGCIVGQCVYIWRLRKERNAVVMGLGTLGLEVIRLTRAEHDAAIRLNRWECPCPEHQRWREAQIHQKPEARVLN